jgi:hypothetical protein
VAKLERAFYTLDQELRLVDAGPRAQALWGKARRELVGRRLTEVFPAVEGSPMHQSLLEALRTLRPTRLTTDSPIIGRPIEIEIYPVSGRLQVSFWDASA